MTALEEIVLVSRLAASLAPLPDAALSNPSLRCAAYPLRALSALDLAAFQRLDLAACRAEMIRRALRVGAGFQQREAA